MRRILGGGPAQDKVLLQQRELLSWGEKKTAAVSFWEDLVGNVFLLLIKAHTDVESVHAKKKKNYSDNNGGHVAPLV